MNAKNWYNTENSDRIENFCSEYENSNNNNTPTDTTAIIANQTAELNNYNNITDYMHIQLQYKH